MLSYTENQKGMFNAWWMAEDIQFDSHSSKLRDGDRVIVANKVWTVLGWTEGGERRRIQNDPDLPTLYRVVPEGRIVVIATRSEIARHGERLGYHGNEEVWSWPIENAGDVTDITTLPKNIIVDYNRRFK